jgi:HAD superfamily hydrolase (TIGR01509 family)
MADIRAVIFDMDGLMFDTEPLSLSSWKDAAKQFGYELSDEFLRSLIGRNYQDVRPLIFQQTGEEFPLDDVFKVRLQLTFDTIEANGVPLKPGLIELLDFLEQHDLPKAVGTSADHRRAHLIMEQSGLLHRFKRVVSASDVGIGKPAPDIFLKAAEHLNVEPHHCLVLEDSESGILAAHRAEMKSALIPDLKPPSQEIAALADYQFTSLTEVHSIFNV